MRCPHCAGQIPDRSRFCGICGRKIPADAAAVDETSADTPAAAVRDSPSMSGGGSMSLFELPVSKGARLARVLSILALDAVLVGTGVAMILSYMNARDQHRSTPRAPDAAVARAHVEVLPPEPLSPGAATAPGTSPPAGKVHSGTTATRTPGKRARPGKAKPTAKKPAGKKPPSKKPPSKKPPSPTAPPPPAPPDARGGTGTPPGAGPGSGPPPVTSRSDAGVPSPGPSAAAGDAGVPAAPPGGPTEEEITLLANRIALVVDRQRSQLQRCYGQAAKATSPSDPLEGKVVIRFEVLPTGKARNVRAMSNTTQSTQLASCLRKLVQSWTFPPSSQPIEFAWPFVFKAPK